MQDPLVNMTHAVVKAYQSRVTDPITLHKGEAVRVGPAYEDDPDWRGWVWCENDAGQRGWVPRSIIDKRGAIGRSLADYGTHLCPYDRTRTPARRDKLPLWGTTPHLDHRRRLSAAS